MKRNWWTRLKYRICGILCEFKEHGETITVYKSGWVQISDGESWDAMPLCLTSLDFQARVELEVKKED